jgi:uncharacterized protein YkwD
MKDLILLFWFIYLASHPAVGQPLVHQAPHPAITPAPVVQAVEVTPPSYMVNLINAERAKAGVKLIVPNDKLMASAEAKCLDMIKRGYWAHFASDGTSPWQFFIANGYNYRYAGENLARDYATDHDSMVALMASPTHRDNILNSKYKEVGIGKCSGLMSGVQHSLVVQHFGTKE